MLAAIYNVFDSEQFLEKSIRQIKPVADKVIAVAQTKSNYGETYLGGVEECERLAQLELIDHIIYYEPAHYTRKPAGELETEKRERGRVLAAHIGCQHFIQMDCDELYFTHEFDRAYQIYLKHNVDASVCRLKTYFKKPTWQLMPDENYWVPGFHKIRMSGYMGRGEYPMKGGKYFVDPTRKVHGCKSIIQLPMTMHHYSWVRNDIAMKLRNSTSRGAFGNILDTVEAFNQFDGSGPVPFYNNFRIIEVPNHFDL